MSPALTRPLAKNLAPALVLAQSWHVSGMLSPIPPPIRVKSSRNRFPRRASLKAPWSISSSTQRVASVGRPDAFDVAGEAGKPDLVRRNPIAYLDQPIRALSNES